MAIQSSDKPKGAIFNEINITPLTDIFLVLLIIMMVMAPMFQAIEKNINLPEINSGMNVEDKNVTVSITQDAQYFINGNPVDSVKLQETLASLLNDTKDKNVVVKADAQTKSKEILKVLRAAEYAGYEKLTIAGEPLTKKQQGDLKSNDTGDPESLPQ